MRKRILRFDKYFVTRTYRYGRRRYRKKWYQKKAKDKRGFMRYSTGIKWSGQSDPEKPAFYRSYMEEQHDNSERLKCGYTTTQTWIALCKSWNGFLLAKREGEVEEMKQYAGQIRKLAKDLGYEPNDFADTFTPEELQEIDKEHDEEALRIRYGTTCGF